MNQIIGYCAFTKPCEWRREDDGAIEGFAEEELGEGVIAFRYGAASAVLEHLLMLGRRHGVLRGPRSGGWPGAPPGSTMKVAAPKPSAGKAAAEPVRVVIADDHQIVR